MSSEPPPRSNWEELLSNQDIVVLTKDTFFRTVDLLFHFAESPERCTWEFFHYRGYEYILGTWCATFNIEGFAISCGAQHPFIHRLKRGMHYVLPDYVLLSHHRNANGEQEDHLVLVVEVKALGEVEPDTQAGRMTAEKIFQKAWIQRENQARLAFRSHPSQQTVNIIMASGPWFALYVFERSRLMRDGASKKGYSIHDSPTMKQRKRARGAFVRDDAEPKDKQAAPFTAAQQVAGDTGVRPQEDTTDTLASGSGKRKREAEAHSDTTPVVNHLFKLGPSGERDALNPWFLHMLGQMRNNLERFSGEFKAQNSWFDWPADLTPTGDGHAEGFVLPTTEGPILDDEYVDVGHIIRLDEDPALVSRANVSTPGSSRETLSMLEVNALLSPTLHRRSRTIPDDQHQEAQSVDTDSASGTDEDTTPKGQRGRQSMSQDTSGSQRRNRELSPSAAYLKRREHGPVNPSQFYPAPPDSSPPRLTPQKQLFFPSAAHDGDFAPLTEHSSPGPEVPVMLRPASVPPAHSSLPSYAPQPLSHAYPASRSNQPLLSDRAQKDHVSRSTLPAHPTPLPIPATPSLPIPAITYVNPLPFHIGAPRLPITRRGDPSISKKDRETATAEEWDRDPPTKDELMLIVLKAFGKGIKDHEKAFTNAGMTQSQALSACRQYDVAWSGDIGTSGTPASFAGPALNIQHTASMRGDASQMPRSGATGPPPASWGARASRAASPTHPSRPTNESDSESLNDDYSDDPRSQTALGPTSDAQVNRLTEGLGNLDVTNLSGAGGNFEWNHDNLYGFEPLACQNRLKIYRALGIKEKSTEDAYRGHVLKIFRDSRGQDAQFFPSFLIEHKAKAEKIDEVMKALAEKQRRTTAGGHAHSLHGPSNREREDPPRQQTDSESDSAGSSRGDTSRKGKEKQR